MGSFWQNLTPPPPPVTNVTKDYAGPEKLDIRTFTVVERTNKGINVALAFLLVLDYMLSTGSM